MKNDGRLSISLAFFVQNQATPKMATLIVVLGTVQPAMSGPRSPNRFYGRGKELRIRSLEALQGTGER
jgi:hypothetical protein